MEGGDRSGSAARKPASSFSVRSWALYSKTISGTKTGRLPEAMIPMSASGHPHGWVLSIHSVRTIMLVEEELAQPWGVVWLDAPTPRGSGAAAIDRGLEAAADGRG